MTKQDVETRWERFQRCAEDYRRWPSYEREYQMKRLQRQFDDAFQQWCAQ